MSEKKYKLDNYKGDIHVSGMAVNPGSVEAKNNHRKRIHDTENEINSTVAFDLEILKTDTPINLLFDEELNPKDPFWDLIGYNQDELANLLAKGSMPDGITIEEFAQKIAAIKILR